VLAGAANDQTVGHPGRIPARCVSSDWVLVRPPRRSRGSRGGGLPSTDWAQPAAIPTTGALRWSEPAEPWNGASP
jgi:hypothetical protein